MSDMKDLEHDTVEDAQITPPCKVKEEFDEIAYLEKLQKQYLEDLSSPHWKRH